MTKVFKMKEFLRKEVLGLVVRRRGREKLLTRLRRKRRTAVVEEVSCLTRTTLGWTGRLRRRRRRRRWMRRWRRRRPRTSGQSSRGTQEEVQYQNRSHLEEVSLQYLQQPLLQSKKICQRSQKVDLVPFSTIPRKKLTR